MERRWNYTDRRKRKQSEKTVALRSPQIPHGLAWIWTLDFALKVRRLPPLAITWPSSGCERCLVKLLKIQSRGLFQNISVPVFLMQRIFPQNNDFLRQRKRPTQRTFQIRDRIWTPRPEFQLTSKVNFQEYFCCLWVRRFFKTSRCGSGAVQWRSRRGGGSNIAHWFT
jgi:hypothetical protein